LAEYIFIPQHIIFPGGSVTPGSRWPNVMSGQLIVSARPKIDT